MDQDDDSEHVIFFDPQAYADEHNEFKLEDMKLTEERLRELAIQVSKFRSKIMEKA